jgi:glycosyltransferase involved in cell wall biosynthesis
MEAASLQKPIITTNVAGCRQVVEDYYTGFLCEVKNPEDLAVKMDKMMKLSEAERRQMGVNGRRKMEREFSDSHVIRKYLTLINELKEQEFHHKQFEMLA